MWKFVGDSVDGISHRRQNIVCQDNHHIELLHVDHGEYLVSACSDGAGSAKAAHLGSKIAVDQAIRLATEYLRAGQSLTPDCIRSLMKDVRSELHTEAEQLALSPRDLACTLLLAIVGSETSAFLQIGDGAIVVLEEDQYKPVFWPQSGEYQNETCFVTDKDVEQGGLIEIIPRGIDEVAIFTDGLQMLALNYAEKRAHQPFFAPIFKTVRGAETQAELVEPLHQFLESAQVNARTDDDKTLVLAVRLSSSATDPLR